MDTAVDDDLISVGALQIRASDGLVTAAGRPLTLSIGEQTVFVVTGRFRELGEERGALPRDEPVR